MRLSELAGLARWRNASLLRRVLVPMLVVFVLTVVVSATLVRKESMHELEEVITANLSTSARSLFGILRSEIRNNDWHELQSIVDRYSDQELASISESDGEHDDDEDHALRTVYLQLMLPAKNAVIASRQQLLIPEGNYKQGFFHWQEGERTWQMVGISDEQTGAWFYMGQRDDYLQETHEESTEAMVGSLLLVSPLLAVVIWYGLLRGLRPLRELSEEIDQRKSENMQPLELRDSVAETKPVIRAINELLERLTAALANERQFTADAAHELRTPIASLRAQLGVLDGARSEQERRDAERSIDRATERMAALVSNLLALARLDSNDQLPAGSDYDLRSSLEEVMAEQVVVAMQKDVEISLQGLPSCPLTGLSYLHELLAANLISNAIKYTPSGGQVDVYLERSGESLVYRVEDTGPGVPEHELPMLTERFRRVRDRGGESADGAGLGLSIAAKCAQLAGAELRLSNRSPNGFCAEVIFPKN